MSGDKTTTDKGDTLDAFVQRLRARREETEQQRNTRAARMEFLRRLPR